MSPSPTLTALAAAVMAWSDEAQKRWTVWAGHRQGEPGEDARGAGDVEPGLAGLGHVAADDVLDVAAVDLRAPCP